MSALTPRKVATPQGMSTPPKDYSKRTPRKTTPMVTFARSPFPTKPPQGTTDGAQVHHDENGGESIMGTYL